MFAEGQTQLLARPLQGLRNQSRLTGLSQQAYLARCHVWFQSGPTLADARELTIAEIAGEYPVSPATIYRRRMFEGGSI